MPRFDYAIFDDGRFVTNALLTPDEAERYELDGMRCVRVTDQPGEGLPAFRGRRSVAPGWHKRGWQRD